MIKKVIEFILLSLFFFLAFIYSYGGYYSWPLDQVPSTGDFVLNFAQTVDSAKIISSFNWDEFWNLGQFFPFKATKALSDHQFIPGVLTALFHQTGLRWEEAFSLVLILFYCLNGICCYYFLRQLNIAKPAAFLCSCFFAINHYRSMHFGQTQLLPTFWYPLIFMGMLSYWQKPNFSSGIFAIINILGLAFTAPYLFVFFIPFAVVSLPLIAYKTWKNLEAKLLISLGIVAISAIFLILDLYYPYIDAKNYFGMIREDGERLLYSFRSNSFNANDGLKFPWPFIIARTASPESTAYIPFVWRFTFIIGILSLLITKYRESMRNHWTILWFSLFIGLLYLNASFGPEGALGVSSWSFFSYLKVFDGVRCPARMIIIFQFFMVVITGLILSGIVNKTKKISYPLSLILAILLGIELTPEIHVHAKVDFSQIESVAKTIKTHSGLNRKIPSIYFPLHADEDFQAFVATSQLHLVNGRSGYTPFTSEHLIFPRFANCQRRNCLQDLRNLGVKYSIIDQNKADPKLLSFFAEHSSVSHVLTEGKFIVYSLNNEYFPKLVSGDREFLQYYNTSKKSKKCNNHVNLHSSHNSEQLPLALDHNLKTRWTTNTSQGSGQWLEIAFPRVFTKGISIKFFENFTAPSERHFFTNLGNIDILRSFSIEDDKHNKIDYSCDYGLEADRFVHTITLYPEHEFEKIRINAEDSKWVANFWSIYDFEVCEHDSIDLKTAS